MECVNEREGKGDNGRGTVDEREGPQRRGRQGDNGRGTVNERRAVGRVSYGGGAVRYAYVDF